MDAFITPLVVLFVLVIVLFLFARALEKRNKTKIEYVQKEVLFSPAERSFLGILESAIDENSRVFAKVRVADVLTPSVKATNRSMWQTAFNRISSKHFDYIICDKSTLEIRAAIELDDKSHNSKTVMARDSFINDICQNANLPLVRFSAKRTYEVNKVKSLIRESLINTMALSSTNTKVLEGEPAKDGEPSLLASSKIAKKLNMSTDSFIENLEKSGYIEKCGSEMVLTALGISVGGVHVPKSRFGSYFKWPADFVPRSAKIHEDE